MDQNVQARVNAVLNHAVEKQLIGLLGSHIIFLSALLIVEEISLRRIKLDTTGLTLQCFLLPCILANQLFNNFNIQNCCIYYLLQAPFILHKIIYLENYKMKQNAVALIYNE